MTSTSPKAFRPYLAAMGTWFVAFGVGTVVFPWLTTEILREPAWKVGVAQMAMMGPSILFMLWGGAVADRRDSTRVLLACHVLMMLPPLAMAAILLAGALSYPAMIAYGLALGTISAFAIPARDGMLARVTSMPLPRAVGLVTAAQFLFQLLGIAAASLADRVGGASLLIGQTGLMALGAFAAMRLPAMRGAGAANAGGGIRDGLSVAAKSDQIWPVVVLLLAVGLFYVGTFIVVLPVAVRDAYGGGSDRLAAVNLCFWAGTILASLAMVRFGAALKSRGRAIVIALSLGAVVLVALGFLPPFPVLLALCFVWGTGAGVTMTQGRTIVQVAAPDSHRSRLMALFQLGFMGGAPIGAVAMGALANAFSLSVAMWCAAGAMVLTVAAVVATSSIWSRRLEPADGNETAGV